MMNSRAAAGEVLQMAREQQYPLPFQPEMQ
jgi:hypothetical protein